MRLLSSAVDHERLLLRKEDTLELVARVGDVLRITGRGVVLALDFASQTAKVQVGDLVQLKSADGTITESKIHGISHLKPLKGYKSNWGIMLAPPQNELDFEQGTEIWVVVPRDAESGTD